jgi:methylenetetrahydrofolate reductase (NADPH)
VSDIRSDQPDHSGSRTPRVCELLTDGPTKFSFEFFPPKTEKGWDKLFDNIADLVRLEPAYVSVTYGAGGTTRENTHRLVQRIQREVGLTVVAHLTCVGHSREEIDAILDAYWDDGVVNILALRGDPPQDKAIREKLGPKLGPDGSGSRDFPFASELVAHVKSRYPDMSVGVAGFVEGHPATPNRLREMDNLKAKVDAGADYIVTQLFFDNRDYYDYVERCRLAGITVPVVAGVMPITSRKGMGKMAELAAGARFPAQLLRSLSRAQSDESYRRVGVHWATEQVSNLLNNEVPGIHLYTLNASTATLQICESLGMESYALA